MQYVKKSIQNHPIIWAVVGGMLIGFIFTLIGWKLWQTWVLALIYGFGIGLLRLHLYNQEQTKALSNNPGTLSKEFIICAAIWVNDGKKYPMQPVNIDTGYVLQGVTHAHCIAISYILNPHHEAINMSKSQGFISSHYRYVDREEAAKIAYRSGQIRFQKNSLYSENLTHEN